MEIKMNTFETMPDNLPKPIDDGACDHLIGMQLPNIDLLATNGSTVKTKKSIVLNTNSIFLIEVQILNQQTLITVTFGLTIIILPITHYIKIQILQKVKYIIM